MVLYLFILPSMVEKGELFKLLNGLEAIATLEDRAALSRASCLAGPEPEARSPLWSLPGHI